MNEMNIAISAPFLQASSFKFQWLIQKRGKIILIHKGKFEQCRKEGTHNVVNCRLGQYLLILAIISKFDISKISIIKKKVLTSSHFITTKVGFQ